MITILYRVLLLFIGVGFLTFPAICQQSDKDLISGSFVDLSFNQFVKEIESRTDYRFYYNTSSVDTLTVNVKVEAKPLPQVLKQLFAGKDFRYAIDGQKRVFVTYGRVITTELPTGFFDRSEENTSDINVAALDYLKEEKEEKLKTATENKLFEIGVKTSEFKAGNATLAGHMRDTKTGEPVIGGVIFLENPWIGASTDQFGYYSITLPRGRHELKIKSVGYKNTKRQILLYSDGKLDIELLEDVVSLKEVVVESEKNVNVSGMQMGVEKLDIKTLKQVPTAFGETDLLRVVLTLPGVKSVGENSTGLNVRGGATDQNLILFNDATIYNPTHLFGFFSAFNPDVLKNVELYKSGIPSKFGGRLSSVLDITTREGNKKKFAASGGIGLVTGRLTLEGPIVKDKTSFILGGRSSYSNWLLRQVRKSAYSNSQASFYDLNAHVSHTFNDKNNLYVTAYLSKDRFKLNTDTLYNYKNQNAILKWKHIFNNKLYGVFTGGLSQYSYSVESDANPVNAYQLTFAINQSNLKADFNYFPSQKHSVDFGISSNYYKLFPGSFTPYGEESLVIPDQLQAEQALESAIYLSDRFDISPRLSVNVGLRYSLFNYLGPGDVYRYPEGISKSKDNIRDTLTYQKGEVISTYHGPEYRVTGRYLLSNNSSVKVSYNTMRQYIHMLSNTTTMSPTDVWKLSDSYIQPQVGDQISIGFYKNLKANTMEASIEGYYKKSKNFLDYKGGASLIMNHQIETDVISTIGRAYGVELLVKKLTGKLNGWVSYTYSRSLLQAEDPKISAEISKGKFYPSNFDKPHDFTLIGNYKFSRRFSFSLNFTYNTGRPITLPLAKYDLAGTKRVYYSDRNQYRIPDYYRVDLSMNIEGNHKIKKFSHSSWTFAVYNLTGRRNPYSVYFQTEKSSIRGYQLSIFGQPIPTITYNFKI